MFTTKYMKNQPKAAPKKAGRKTMKFEDGGRVYRPEDEIDTIAAEGRMDTLRKDTEANAAAILASDKRTYGKKAHARENVEQVINRQAAAGRNNSRMRDYIDDEDVSDRGGAKR